MPKKKTSKQQAVNELPVVSSKVSAKQRRLIDESASVGEIPFLTYELLRNKFLHIQ